LKIGEIEIKFSAGEAAKTESTSEIASTPTVEQNQAVELGVIQDNVERADDELATMHISDPAQFERLLIERELESGKH
jgi:hypothetical protein